MARMGLTPEKVVTAAARLADQVGIGRLSLSAVAAQLGVRVPSLYKHVGGLDDLQRRLAVQGAEELADAVQAAASGKHGRAALSAVARAYRDYARDNRGCYQAMVLRGAEDAQRPDQFGPVDVVLRLIAADYGLGPEQARHAARTVLSTLHGFVLLEADGGFDLNATVAVLDSGLTALAQGRQRFRRR